MKGTARARFVGIGVQRPEYVDKHPTWGQTYDPDVASIEQTGRPLRTYVCDPCDYTGDLTDPTKTWTIRTSHERSKRHQRLAAKP